MRRCKKLIIIKPKPWRRGSALHLPNTVSGNIRPIKGNIARSGIPRPTIKFIEN
jgi:hypothetical protein